MLPRPVEHGLPPYATIAVSVLDSGLPLYRLLEHQTPSRRDFEPRLSRTQARIRGLPGLFKTELHASIVELNTGICATVDEARAALAALRRTAAELARAEGMVIAAAGTHPFSRAEEQEVVQEKRYKMFLAYGGVSVRRQAVNGLHVHVGV